MEFLKPNEVLIFDDVLDDDILSQYLLAASEHVSSLSEMGLSYDDLSVRFCGLGNDDPIVSLVKKRIEIDVNVELKLDDVHFHFWTEGMEGQLHKHDSDGRKHCDYNSILYLNDDFEGGEFFTNEISITPKKNRLTFFNGRDMFHGVKPVIKGNRYTILFWWADTKFNY